MHSFKRIIYSVLAILIVITTLSVIVIEPYMNSESAYFQDKNLRKQLSGKIDCIALGASHALNGIIPAVLDEKLGCFSYNLSGSMMTLNNKYYMLSKELKRNPVKTVILEISHDTLSRDETDEYAIGDEPTVARLDSFAERVKYMLQYVTLNDWLNVYSREFVMGLYYHKEKLLHHNTNNVDYAAKGFSPSEACDITLTAEEAKEKYNSGKISVDYQEKNIKELDKIIDLCHSYNCRIVIAVVPESDSLIWEMDGWDEFKNWLENYSEKNGCEIYDINLVKNRTDIFSDKDSFSNAGHLCSAGADATTELLAQAMLSPTTWPENSYDSYESMKKDLPYADLIQ